MEAVSLRSRKLLRQGYRDAGVVIAEDLDSAELRFFETWKAAPAADAAKGYRSLTPNAASAYPDAKFAAASAEQNVIGMFPTPGQR
jgi:hypothetical protein